MTKVLDDYKSKEILKPKNKGTELRYYKMYDDYMENSLTIKQLALKYRMTPTNAGRIVKWVTHQFGEIDTDQEMKALIDKQLLRQQEIKKELSECENVKQKVMLWQELRRTDRFIAEMSGVLKRSLIDVQDNRVVNIIKNETLKSRRKGTREIEEKTIEAEVME